MTRARGRQGARRQSIGSCPCRPDEYRLTRPRNCRRPILFTAEGTRRWSFTFPVELEPGRYRVQARSTDRARNKETPGRRSIVSFRVR